MTSLRIDRRKAVLAVLSLLLSVAVITRLAFATNIQYYSLTFTYNQTSAREMLDSLNQWRTGKSWYWNSDNTTKTTVSAGSRKALVWDYNLEKIAMQRAYEIVLLCEHERPNGESIYSITVNGVSSCGENLCSGSGDTLDSYEKALTAWIEEDCNYAGQGHRRNMLEKSFTSIGIAHVVVGNTHYWVQEFGRTTSSPNPEFATDDSTDTVDVPYNADKMELYAFVEQRPKYGSYYQAKAGVTNPCPDIHLYMGVIGSMQPLITTWTWGNGDKTYVIEGVFSGFRISSGYSVVWSSTDESIAKIVDGNKYQVIGSGNCLLTADITYNGKTTSCDMRLEALSQSIDESSISVSISPVTYTGSAVTPEFTVTNNGNELVSGRDFTYYCTDNTEAGFGYLVINGNGGYTGQRKEKFSILQKKISSTDIRVEGIADQPYTGSEIRPEFTVYDGDTELVYGTDYTYSFSQNTQIGKATLTISGIGNYSSSKFVDFHIYDPAAPTTSAPTTAAPTSEASVTTSAVPTGTSAAETTEAVMTTTPMEPTTAPFTTAPSLPTSEAAATTEASVTSEASGTTPAAQTTGAPVPSGALSIQPIADQFYDGSEKKPGLVVKCGDTVLDSVDYNVVYDNNIDAGTATVFVSGKGIYVDLDPVTAKFTIHPMNITGKASIAKIDDQVYSGEEITPALNVSVNGKELVAGTDYTVVYEDNTSAGTAKVTVTGANNYTGSAEAGFNIVPSSSAATVSAIADQTYTGSQITPDIEVYVGSVLLTAGTDYDATFSNNTGVGTASVSVTLKGNYSGTYTASFNIVKRPVSTLTIAPVEDKVYTRSAIKPSVTVTYGNAVLVQNTDYSLSYSSNTNPGTAAIKITGKGNYTGSTTVNFKITAKDVADLTVSSIEDQNYTGSAVTPAVTVKFGSYELVSGTDYTVAYKNNVNGGTASAVITGKGCYTGTKTVEFRIIKYSWKKISGKWYYIDDKGTKATGFRTIDGATYYFDSTGIMLTGWQKISNKWYYFNSSGVMKTDWQKISKKWYYFASDGVMATGLTKIGSTYYYFDTSGVMKTKWISVSGKWYYFASGGNAVTGWQKISKKWYYFDKSTCIMATGFAKIDGATYYFDAGGIMKTKWVQVSGKWYYFNSDGSMVAGTSKKIGTKTYKFDADGVCLNP